MIKLSKKSEYGIIAVRHIALLSNQRIATAKEIADRYKIPYELLAKVMQKMTRHGLIVSHQGVNGGYSLARRAEDITVLNIIEAIEGTIPSIAQCFTDHPTDCSIYDNCAIKNPLGKLQHTLENVFSGMKVSEIV